MAIGESLEPAKQDYSSSGWEFCGSMTPGEIRYASAIKDSWNYIEVLDRCYTRPKKDEVPALFVSYKELGGAEGTAVVSVCVSDNLEVGKTYVRDVIKKDGSLHWGSEFVHGEWGELPHTPVVK